MTYITCSQTLNETQILTVSITFDLCISDINIPTVQGRNSLTEQRIV